MSTKHETLADALPDLLNRVKTLDPNQLEALLAIAAIATDIVEKLTSRGLAVQVRVWESIGKPKTESVGAVGAEHEMTTLAVEQHTGFSSRYPGVGPEAFEQGARISRAEAEAFGGIAPKGRLN
jgi:hypothetical protein